KIRDIYGAPDGCLLLARRNHSIIGCVAFRRFNDASCEMKRLYVKPSARGVNVGRELTVELVHRARGAGYRRMVLDTLPHLKAAQALYRSLGFHEIQPYYVNPVEGAVYMELDLVAKSHDRTRFAPTPSKNFDIRRATWPKMRGTQLNSGVG